jgi:hypothetical protein
MEWRRERGEVRGRVTRLVCEKIAPKVAQPITVSKSNVYFLPLEKSGPKNWDTSVIKNAQ